MSDIQTLMRTANPIPEASAEFGPDDLDVLLLLIQRRSGDMDVKDMAEPATPETKPKRGWLIAAAAAVAVVLVVGIAMLLDTGTDDGAPATSPTTTLDAAPTSTTSTGGLPELDPAAAAFAQAMVDEVNAGDHGAAAARIYAAATYEGEGDDASIDARARSAGRFAVWVALDSTVELVECSSLTNGTTRCEIARSSPHDYSSADPAMLLLQFRLDESGAAAYMRLVPAGGAWSIRYDAFERWVNENHPEHWAPMFFDFTDPETSARLIREYYARYESRLPDAQSAFVVTYQDIYLTGTRGDFTALFARDAGRLWAIENPLVVSADRLADEMIALRERNTSTTLSDCRVSGDTVRCDVVHAGPVEQALVGGDVTIPTSFQLNDEGLIEEIRLDSFFVTGPVGEAMGRFASWIEREQPDIHAQMVPIGQAELYADPLDTQIWLEWAPRWAEAGRP